MIQQIVTNNIPFKLWLADIEGGAMEQAENLENLYPAEFLIIFDGS